MKTKAEMQIPGLQREKVISAFRPSRTQIEERREPHVHMLVRVASDELQTHPKTPEND